MSVRPDALPFASEHFREIIPTRADAALEGFSLADGHLIANYLENNGLWNAAGNRALRVELHPTRRTI